MCLTSSRRKIFVFTLYLQKSKLSAALAAAFLLPEIRERGLSERSVDASMEARLPCTGFSPAAFSWVPIPLRYCTLSGVDRFATPDLAYLQTYEVGFNGSIVLL